MIEVKNLSKTFIYQGKKIKILDDVSFKVENKDKIAVIGRNGAGKSTFLNIIGGVESPDKGEIKTDKIPAKEEAPTINVRDHPKSSLIG